MTMCFMVQCGYTNGPITVTHDAQVLYTVGHENIAVCISL